MRGLCWLLAAVLRAVAVALLAVSPTAAAVPNFVIEGWRNGAPEIVTMTTVSVDTKTTNTSNPAMGPRAIGTRIDVTVTARVEAVTRTASGLVPGSQLVLRYTVTRSEPPVPDGNIGFVIGQGERALAHLKRAADGSYELAGAIGCLAVLSSPGGGASVPPPGGERRAALVIGNGAYANVAALGNPANDARAMAAALRGVGFTAVRLETDLRRDTLLAALKSFAAEAESADWAVIYFAGHGIEVAGVNWLVPVDAALKTDRDVQYEAVSLDQVLGAVEGAKKLSLVILDACRDNPFAARMRVTAAGRSIARGLAAVEPRRGTLIAYAAKHGQVALDGADANSPFAAALVRNLGRPGLELNKVFRHVRDDVLAATNDRQEPFVYGTLPAQDFFFRQ